MDSDSERTDDLRSLDVDRLVEQFDEDTLPATTDEETYDTVDEFRLAVLNGVQRDAVGRPRYSDRDPPDVAEDRDLEQSF